MSLPPGSPPKPSFAPRLLCRRIPGVGPKVMYCRLGVKLLSKLDESGSKLGMQGLKLDSSPDIGSKLGESGVEVGSRDKEATSIAGRSWGNTSKNCNSLIDMIPISKWYLRQWVHGCQNSHQFTQNKFSQS